MATTHHQPASGSEDEENDDDDDDNDDKNKKGAEEEEVGDCCLQDAYGAVCCFGFSWCVCLVKLVGSLFGDAVIYRRLQFGFKNRGCQTGE